MTGGTATPTDEQRIEVALDLWGMAGAAVRLIATRENHVYRVDHEAASYALRLHRRGYRTDPELRSELAWMGAVAAGGVSTPTPVLSKSGDLLHTIEGVQIDMLSWLDGAPIGATGAPLTHPDPHALHREIGRDMARLHAISDRWTPPPDFTRWRWDRPGLLGDAPVWGRFWENPTLSRETRLLFEATRSEADALLARLEPELDFGLIHADLLRENILSDGAQVRFIDFDDGGFGFRLFDIATTLLKSMNEPAYPALKAGLLEGYSEIRALDATHLDLFLLLRSLTYVGWIAARLDEPDARARNDRNVAAAATLARDFLTQGG